MFLKALVGPSPLMPAGSFAGPIIMKSLRLQGIFVGSIDMFNRMNHAVEKNRIRPVIDKVFKFNDAHKAFAHMAKGNHFGKVCISV